MNFVKTVKLIFKAIPEFKASYNEVLDVNYYNSFLGDFGLFTRDAISQGVPYAKNCLSLINDMVNTYKDDDDFVNMLVVNILEVLTDYEVTQKMAFAQFDNYCLRRFNMLFEGGYFRKLV